ncbi:MAG TPA: DNA gyrase modulator, partial [Gammaproteobacteria bacterium]
MFTHTSADDLERAFQAIVREHTNCTLRVVETERRAVRIRRGVFEPVTNNFSLGASVTVSESGGTGYAATSDLSAAGLRNAAKEAQLRARVSAAYQLFDASRLTAFTIQQETDLRAGQALPTMPECIDLAARASDRLASAVKSHDARDIVVDWHASLEIFQSCSLL